MRRSLASMAVASTAPATTSSTDTTTGASSGSSSWSRDSSMICCTRRERRSDSVSIRPANRRTATGSSAASHTASGEQPDRADRRLELVGDVGDEVAAHRLHPPLAGAVLDQGQHQRRGQRRHPHGDVAGRHALTGHQQLGLADLAVAAYLRHQLGELVRHQAGAGHQAHGVRRGAGLQHRVVAPDDDRAAAQHREHRGDALGHRGLVGVGHAALLALADVPREHAATGHQRTDQRGDERLRRRVHVKNRTQRFTRVLASATAPRRVFTARSPRDAIWSPGARTVPVMREAYHDQLDSIFRDLAVVCGNVQEAVRLATQVAADRRRRDGRGRDQRRQPDRRGDRAGRGQLLLPALPPAAGRRRPAGHRVGAADGQRARADGRPLGPRGQDRPAPRAV